MGFYILEILIILTCFVISKTNGQGIMVELFNESPQQMPETVLLKVDFRGKIVSFMYKKVHRAQNSNHANYTETLSVAKMSVTRKKNGDGYLYDGSYIHSGVFYLIYPVSSNKYLDASIRRGVTTIKGEEYINAGQVLSTMSGQSYGENVIHGPSYRSLTVELFAHIDYSVYLKWLNFSNGNVDSALKSLKNYYSHVFNGVNINYERIKRADFSISTHLKTLYIQQTHSIYADKDANIGIEQIKISSKNALQVAKDVFDVRHDRGQYDAGIFIANLDMNSVTGRAYERGMCFDIAVGIVSHSNQLELTNTVTHEIAHILGSEHDGYPYNNCNKKKLFLMSPNLETFSQSTVANTFKFSQCSISYIKLFVDQLENEKNNCMLNAVSGNTNLPSDKRLIGEIYSTDQQCKLIHGSESYFCGQVEKDICQNLSCYNPLRKNCWHGKRQTAADGSKCGSCMWCLDGMCVENGRHSR